jgi:hypothetical protein
MERDNMNKKLLPFLLLLLLMIPNVFAASIINEQWDSYDAAKWDNYQGGGAGVGVNGGHLEQEGSGGATDTTYYMNSFSSSGDPSLRFETKVMLASPSGSGGNTQILWFGLTNGKTNSQFDTNGRYIAFYVSSASGGWCVKYANGGAVQTPYSGGSWGSDTWYNLTITKAGDDYAFYIDGNLVWSGTVALTSFTTFYLGLGGEFRNYTHHESDYVLIDSPTSQFYLTIGADNNGVMNYSSGFFDKDTVLYVLDTPNVNYQFSNFTLDAVNSTNNPITVTMDQNHTLTADNTLIYRTLTIGADNHGSMNQTTAQFPNGTTVYILDTPNNHYLFSNFTLDGNNSTSNPIQILMSADHTLTADNIIGDYYLDVTAPSNGALNVTSAWYASGTTVYLEATPAINYEFAAIDIDGTNETQSHITSVTMDENHTCTAYFDLIWDYLTLTIPSNGGLNRSSAYWPNGTEVYVLATPDPLYHFVAYSLDGGANTTANPIKIIMDGDHTLTTYFELNLYNLTVGAPIGGSLNQSSENFIVANTSIIIEATPDVLHTFDCFTLDGSNSTDNPLTMIMDQNHTLSVNFDLIPRYTLTINAPSGGSINDTTAIYLSGSLVYLSEIPGTNQHFLTWVVDGVNNTNPQISIYMDGNHTITALFAPNSTPALHIGDSPNTPGSELVILFVLILALVIWQRQKLKVPHIKT